MRKIIGAVALALFLFATQQPLSAQDNSKPLTLTEKATLLGKLTDSKDTKAVSISDDYNHLAVLSQKGAKYFVTLDGAPGKEYDWIVRGSLGFSMDSKHFGYVVQQGDDMFVVMDGKEGKAYREIAASNITYAPAGARYAYYARPKAGGKWVAVVDGQESKEFDQIGNLSFSPDGKRLAFGVEQGGKQFFVVDNAVGGEREFDKVAGASFTWSPDGKRYAYGAVRDAKVIIIADAKEGKPYKESTRPIFSPDSQHLVYVGMPEDKKGTLVADGEEQKQYRRIHAESIRFSPDSKRLAYIATRADPKDPAKEEMFFVIDEQETPNYEALKPDSFVFSPDSKRTSFQCVKNKKAITVLDGVEGKEYDDIRLVQFSPDSKKVAYIALRDRRVFAVVDGAEGRGYDGIANLLFSKDGKMAFVAAKGKKQCVVINGVEAKNDYDGVVPDNLAFSADGKHLAYEARKGEKPLFVIDDSETKEHAGSLRGSRLTWDSPTSLHALILRGDKKEEKEVVRLQVDIAGG
jgi:WD40 repeat protein